MQNSSTVTQSVQHSPASFAPDNGLLSSLGRFACEFELEQAPEVVRRQARLTLLDTVGCMVAGVETPESQAFVSAERELSARPQASVVGQREKMDMAAATRSNAYFGDVFELNDLTGGHAGIAVVPATLAYAEAKGRSGHELATAIIVGIESVSRLYAAYYPTMKPYTSTGITPPGIPSTLGTTAGLARLAGFNVAQATRALQIAAALAGWCPAEVIFGQGGSIKPMMFGAWPGSVALQAIAYANAGFDGPSQVLESPIGLYATLAHSYDPKAITEPSVWHLAQPRRKRHACCGYIHSAIDAVIELRRQGVRLEDAAHIKICMPAYIIPGVSKTQAPCTANEARFHAQYCIALAINGARLILPHHSSELARHLPAVQHLLDRIHVVQNEELTHYHQCVVHGLRADGSEAFSQRLSAPKGAPLDPLSDDEVRGKFRQLCAESMDSGALDAYIEDIDALESASKCDWIIGRFA
jgi:2-methylcitrate dehydratase PrpD